VFGNAGVAFRILFGTDVGDGVPAPAPSKFKPAERSRSHSWQPLSSDLIGAYLNVRYALVVALKLPFRIVQLCSRSAARSSKAERTVGQVEARLERDVPDCPTYLSSGEFIDTLGDWSGAPAAHLNSLKRTTLEESTLERVADTWHAHASSAERFSCFQS